MPNYKVTTTITTTVFAEHIEEAIIYADQISFDEWDIEDRVTEELEESN
jgi:hypothetical protein